MMMIPNMWLSMLMFNTMLMVTIMMSLNKSSNNKMTIMKKEKKILW